MCGVFLLCSAVCTLSVCPVQFGVHSGYTFMLPTLGLPTPTHQRMQVKPVVLVRGLGGLLDVMEKYVVDTCASGNTMVVMGSQQITSSVFDSVMGSVTLAFIRRMIGLPVVVVTQNSKYSPGPTTKVSRPTQASAAVFWPGTCPIPSRSIPSNAVPFRAT